MDHKMFFWQFKHSLVSKESGFGGFTTEQLYQAIKHRLISELECRQKDGGIFLINTGGGE